jgi:nitroreductase
MYPFERKRHPSAEQVLLLLKTRRSQRKFKDNPIEKKKIEMIVDGARYAPSSDNSQSTQYIVIQDKDVLYRIWEMTARFFEKTVSQLKNPIMRSYRCRSRKGFKQIQG